MRQELSNRPRFVSVVSLKNLSRREGRQQLRWNGVTDLSGNHRLSGSPANFWKVNLKKNTQKIQNKKRKKESKMAEDWILATDEMLEETQKDVELAESSRGYYRIGKLTVGMARFQKWVDRKPVSVTYEEFVKLDSKQRSFEYTFNVDIKEFDERARTEGWDYTRTINPRSPNWWQILEPSIESLLGKGSVNSEHRTKTIKELQGKYVAILDVPQAPGKDGQIPANKETGKVYTTVKFARIFANRDEAKAFYDELKAQSQAAQGDTTATNLPAVPQVWASNPAMLFEMLKTQYAGADPVAAAKSTMLVSKSNEVAVDEKGEKVDLCAIFARAYDQPAEMYRETFKAFV